LWPAILRRYTIVASIKRVNENPELPVSGFLKRLSRVPEDMERVIMSFVGEGKALVTEKEVENAGKKADAVKKELEALEREHVALQEELEEQEFMMLPPEVAASSSSSSSTVGRRRGRSGEDKTGGDNNKKRSKN
jgi:hypothetical protein